MDKRALPRNRVLTAATIKFGGSAIICVVRNITIAGAALDVNSPMSIPDHLTLVLQIDDTRMPCHIVWRRAKRIGVAFDS
jgi:hypothetical protein